VFFSHVLDDGGGMDPEALRRCMSFGFSDKQSDALIGQYGNGFKTSTMRLGADVIVFTQNQNNWYTSFSNSGSLVVQCYTRKSIL
jgi:sensor histidine kinase regulating citrate/malate metabolism